MWQHVAATRNNPYNQTKLEVAARAAWELGEFTPGGLANWIELEYQPLCYKPSEVSACISKLKRAGSIVMIPPKAGDDGRNKRYLFVGDEPEKVSIYEPLPLVTFLPGGIEIHRSAITGDVLSVIRLSKSLRSTKPFHDELWNREEGYLVERSGEEWEMTLNTSLQAPTTKR